MRTEAHRQGFLTTVGNWQSSLYPPQGTLASFVIKQIQTTVPTKKDKGLARGIKALVCRIEACVMPIFTAVSLLQVSGGLVCNITLLFIGQEHASIGKHIAFIMRLTVAIFSSTLCIPLVLIKPNLYHQNKSSSPQRTRIPPSSPQPNRTPPSQPGTEAPLSIPTITSTNWSEMQKQFASNPSRCISLKVLRKEQPSEFGWLGVDINPTEFLGKKPNELEAHFSSLSSAPIPKDPLTHQQPSSFIYPGGSHILKISEKKSPTTQSFAEGVCQIASSPHEIDILDIKGAKRKGSPISVLLKKQDIPSNAAIYRIKTLALRNCTPLSVNDLLEMGRKFPNIACLDIRGTQLQRKNTEQLKKRFIIFETSQHNINWHLKKFNEHVHSAVQTYKEQKIQTPLLDAFPELRAYGTEAGRTPPAACFVQNLSFLRGLSITDKEFQQLLPRILVHMPFVRKIDLSGCVNLTLPSLQLLTQFSFESLNLHGCLNLLKNDNQTEDQIAFQTALLTLLEKGAWAVCLWFHPTLTTLIQNHVFPALQELYQKHKEKKRIECATFENNSWQRTTFESHKDQPSYEPLSEVVQRRTT